MKRLIQELIRISGLIHLVRFFNRDKLTILMLHGVAGEHPSAGWQPLWPRITPRQLDRTLTHLGKHYEFVSFDDAVGMLSGKIPMRKHCLALTFDDGYRNNLSEAYPILKKHSAPATLFIATGYVESGRSYWIDRLDYALQKAPDDARVVSSGDFSFDLRGLDRKGLEKQYKHMRLAVKNNTSTDAEMLKVFDELAAQLEAKAGTSIFEVLDKDPYASVATWSEFEEAANDGVCIGSHTVDHYRLDSVEQVEIDNQLTSAKSDIEAKLSRPCPYFCYPNGSFNDLVVARTGAAGYEAAVTVDHGLNSAGDDLLTLKRFSFPTKDTAFKNLFVLSGIMESSAMRLLRGGGG